MVEKILKTINDLRTYYNRHFLIEHKPIVVFGVHQQLVKDVQSKIVNPLISLLNNKERLTAPSSFSTPSHR